MKNPFKLLVDMAMTLLLLLLMARQITGGTAHEWLGLVLFALWVVHHVLNRKWYQSLAKGRYTPYRVLQIVINSLLLVTMVLTAVSAIILSEDVFAFLSIRGFRGPAQMMHIAGAFWSFVLMAAHLGLHWSVILGKIRQSIGALKPTRRIILRVIGAFVAAWGVYAFIHHQLIQYLTLHAHFVFFDFEQPAVFFLPRLFSNHGVIYLVGILWQYAS